MPSCPPALDLQRRVALILTHEWAGGRTDTTAASNTRTISYQTHLNFGRESAGFARGLAHPGRVFLLRLVSLAMYRREIHGRGYTGRDSCDGGKGELCVTPEHVFPRMSRGRTIRRMIHQEVAARCHHAAHDPRSPAPPSGAAPEGGGTSRCAMVGPPASTTAPGGRIGFDNRWGAWPGRSVRGGWPIQGLVDTLACGEGRRTARLFLADRNL